MAKGAVIPSESRHLDFYDCFEPLARCDGSLLTAAVMKIASDRESRFEIRTRLYVCGAARSCLDRLYSVEFLVAGAEEREGFREVNALSD